MQISLPSRDPWVAGPSATHSLCAPLVAEKCLSALVDPHMSRTRVTTAYSRSTDRGAWLG